MKLLLQVQFLVIPEVCIIIFTELKIMHIMLKKIILKNQTSIILKLKSYKIYFTIIKEQNLLKNYAYLFLKLTECINGFNLESI
jgi:hypothetical protein